MLGNVGYFMQMMQAVVAAAFRFSKL